MTKNEAIEKCGNQTALARLLNITPAAVSQWQTVPPARLWQLKALKPEWFDESRANPRENHSVGAE